MTKTSKTRLLVLTAALAALVGIALAVSPALEHRQAQIRQEALLKSIEQGEGRIVMDIPAAPVEVDYYDGDGTETDVIPLPPVSVSAENTADTVPIETGVANGIGILTIERIDAKLPVTDGATSEQLKIAEGWVPQTAPIGDAGNAVIAGHRSYTYGQHFNRLGEVAEGDTIQYDRVDGTRMEFTVYEILTIEPGDPVAFEQPDDSTILTLYTCTPIRTATHRLLVRAERTN